MGKAEARRVTAARLPPIIAPTNIGAGGSATRMASSDEAMQVAPPPPIGPITADTARELGLRVDLVADDHTVEGLVDKLTAYFASTNEPVQS